MEAVSSIIRDSLQELIVQAVEQPVQAPDFNIAIRYLNRMMNTFFSLGIDLGYTQVKSPSDLLTVPDGAVEGVIFNLALRLSTSYDIAVNPSLSESARIGLKAMRRLGVRHRETRFPATMPRGSGNYYYNGSLFNDKFYEGNAVPSDAFDCRIGQIDSFTVDYTNYLLKDETIVSFEVIETENITVLESVLDNPKINLSIRCDERCLGRVCVSATTSAGRVMPETLYFDISDECNA